MDFAMNEEVNYCDQCGTKVSSAARFCSSCGSVLDGSGSPQFDAHIRVSTHNEITEKGLEGLGRGLSFVLKTLKSEWLFLNRYRKPIFTIFGIGIILLIVAVFLAWLLDKRGEVERSIALQQLKTRIVNAQVNTIDYEWEVLGSDDPASGKTIGRIASIRSDDDLCILMVELQPSGRRVDGLKCNFALLAGNFGSDLVIKFGYDDNTHSTNFSHYNAKIGDVTDAYVIDTSNYRFSNTENYTFSKRLITGGTLAIKIIPRIHPDYYDVKNFITQQYPDGHYYEWSVEQVDPTWITFSLKGAKEAISKLGQEVKQ
jgi:hypothetical protein